MSPEPRYHINVFWFPDDQCWIADVPDLRPCSARGETPLQALTALDPVLAAWLASAREMGEPAPEPRYCPALFAAR